MSILRGGSTNRQTILPLLSFGVLNVILNRSQQIPDEHILLFIKGLFFLLFTLFEILQVAVSLETLLE